MGSLPGLLAASVGALLALASLAGALVALAILAASRGRPERRRVARTLALVASAPLATGLALAVLPEQGWVRARHLDQLALPAALVSLATGSLLAWLASRRRPKPPEGGTTPGTGPG